MFRKSIALVVGLLFLGCAGEAQQIKKAATAATVKESAPKQADAPFPSKKDLEELEALAAEVRSLETEQRFIDRDVDSLDGGAACECTGVSKTPGGPSLETARQTLHRLTEEVQKLRGGQRRIIEKYVDVDQALRMKPEPTQELSSK